MKTKNSSDLVVKIFLIVVAVILVGLLIAWSTGVFKDKKQDLNEGTEKIDQVLSSVADFDLLVYDGYTINGKSLTDLIVDMQNKEATLSVGVKTLAGSIQYYNYSVTADNNLGAVVTITPSTSKADDDYINPSARFLGDIVKNINNEIVCIMFTQQK